ncbi:ninjurin-A-like [Chironomus tepperi]|uniref:ninjurin-A-like n=1 Tax=Chironomus tepperi TaxID=113505 RepID=UPI00391FB9A5
MTTEANVKFSVQNENIKLREIIPPIAKYESFDDRDEYDQVDGDRKPFLNVPGIDDGLIPTDQKPRIVPAGYFPQWPSSYPPEADVSNIPSLNLYQQKKTIAQGMLDLALLSSNANQLRYILDYKERNHYYYISLSCISLSLVLQVLVAIALVFKSRYNIDNEQEYANADRINNFITMGILFITIINVFTSAFGVSSPA